MIKTEKGLLEIKGDLHETLADYTVITVELRKMLEETIGKESAEEEMQKAMQLSRMSEEKRESLVDMSDDEMELCDVEDWYDEGVKAGRMKAYLDVAETIRSHMDDIPNCGECSR